MSPEQKLRMIVSHATMGHTNGEGMSVNDICVRITACRNIVWRDAQIAAAKPYRIALEKILNAPLIDHSNPSNNPKAIAKAALLAGENT